MALTDDEGQFVLRGVAPGAYVLEASLVGYVRVPGT